MYRFTVILVTAILLLTLVASLAIASPVIRLTKLAFQTGNADWKSYSDGRMLGVESVGGQNQIGEYNLATGQFHSLGITGLMPVWDAATGRIYCYDNTWSNGRAGYYIPYYGSLQFMAPYSATLFDTVSTKLSAVDGCFGNFSTDFIYQIPANIDKATACQPFYGVNSSAWWLTSAGIASDGTMVVCGQDIYNPNWNGYEVVKIKDGITTRMGLPMSKIAVVGNMIYGSNYDHSAIWSRPVSDGPLSTLDNNGYFTLIGADSTGVIYRKGSDYWKASTPEPGSLVAMLTGFTGLIGFGLRRRH